MSSLPSAVSLWYSSMELQDNSGRLLAGPGHLPLSAVGSPSRHPHLSATGTPHWFPCERSASLCQQSDSGSVDTAVLDGMGWDADVTAEHEPIPHTRTHCHAVSLDRMVHLKRLRVMLEKFYTILVHTNVSPQPPYTSV